MKKILSLISMLLIVSFAYAALPHEGMSRGLVAGASHGVEAKDPASGAGSFCDHQEHKAGCAKAAAVYNKCKVCKKSGITPRQWCNKQPTPSNCL